MKNKSISIIMSERERWTGLMYLMAELFLLPSALRMVNSWLTRPFSESALNFVFFSINCAAAIFIFRHYLLNSVSEALGAFWESVQAVILGYVAYRICEDILFRLITYVNPGFQNVNDGSIAALAGQNFYLMAVGVVVLVPIAEECFYRGLIFGSLYKRNRILAYAISTAAFAAVHVAGYLGNYSPVTLLICYLQYLPAGLWLAWSYEKSGTVVVPMVIHGIVNYMGIRSVR